MFPDYPLWSDVVPDKYQQACYIQTGYGHAHALPYDTSVSFVATIVLLYHCRLYDFV